MIRKGIKLAGGLLAVVMLLTVTLRELEAGSDPAAAHASAQWDRGPVLILDAGHGGEDGGAVSLTGIPESQINLAIVRRIEDILGLYGISPVLLRREDISLHDSSAVTIREKKVSDLKNRVAAIQEIEDATLISIHQNSYPEGRYHGAQTFYAPTEGSQALAEHIQAAIRQTLQQDNDRQVKEIPDSIYLMNHVDCRAVLVECGFLTNSEEEALLRDAGYQKKLAAALAWAWLTVPEGESPDLHSEANLIQYY